MSERKAIAHFHEYPISWRRIRQLPEDQQAALGIISYAVSETNALAKSYIFSSHKMIGESAIDSATTMQKFVILRSWSAKLIEVETFLKLGGKKKETKDRDLLRLSENALQNFRPLRNTEGYYLARDIRNESTNHYSFSAAKKNLKYVSHNSNCNLYLHDMGGNSFYPMGEEVMFIGRMNRRGANLESKEDKNALLGKWMDWNLDANDWLNEVHSNMVNELIFKQDSEVFAKKKAYWIPMNFVGNQEDNMMPVFLRKKENP